MKEREFFYVIQHVFLIVIFYFRNLKEKRKKYEIDQTRALKF